MAPKLGRGALLASRHPWKVSVALGLVMYTWAKLVVRVTTPQALLAGLVVIAFVLVLWVPRYGLARHYMDTLVALVRGLLVAISSRP